MYTVLEVQSYQSEQKCSQCYLTWSNGLSGDDLIMSPVGKPSPARKPAHSRATSNQCSQVKELHDHTCSSSSNAHLHVHVHMYVDIHIYTYMYMYIHVHSHDIACNYGILTKSLSSTTNHKPRETIPVPAQTNLQKGMQSHSGTYMYLV